MNWLDQPLYAGSVADWGIALTMAVGFMLAAYWLRRLILNRLQRIAARTETVLDDLAAHILSGTQLPFILTVAIYVGAQYLELPATPARVLGHIVTVAVLMQAAFWGNRALTWWLARALPTRRERDAAGATTLSILGFVARLVLWSVALLMILDNLGVNITALVASLGIGGIAVALAAQNILGDIFASLSIALDKPFVIGDFIIVDDILGTVEYVGIKTTRLRSLSGEQIVLSNSDLLNSRIRNHKRMFERRVLFDFGVTYDTPAEKLERIPAFVREIVTAQPQARLDRAHFRGFGDSSLDFEIVYYVQSPEYNVYMDIQQAINLALLRRLRDEDVDFAFPTRTLHLHPAAAEAS